MPGECEVGEVWTTRENGRLRPVVVFGNEVEMVAFEVDYQIAQDGIEIDWKHAGLERPAFVNVKKHRRLIGQQLAIRLGKLRREELEAVAGLAERKLGAGQFSRRKLMGKRNDIGISAISVAAREVAGVLYFVHAKCLKCPEDPVKKEDLLLKADSRMVVEWDGKHWQRGVEPPEAYAGKTTSLRLSLVREAGEAQQLDRRAISNLVADLVDQSKPLEEIDTLHIDGVHFLLNEVSGRYYKKAGGRFVACYDRVVDGMDLKRTRRDHGLK